MPSTYTTNLGIEKIGTGEQSGTWGNTTNTNFDVIDQAINGIAQVTLASAGTSGSPNTLDISDGGQSDGKNKFIEFIDGGDLGATAYVQLTPNDAEKIVHIRNSLSGSRSLVVFQGTYNASNDFLITNGADVLLKFNGAGASATATDVNNKLSVTELLVNTTSQFVGNVTTDANLTVGGEFRSQGIQDFNPSSVDYKITIASTSEVGIGNSSPEDFTGEVVVIGNTLDATASATIVSSTIGEGRLTFSDGSATANRNRGRVSYSHSSDALSFYTGGTERVVISGGNADRTTTFSGLVGSIAISPAGDYISDPDTVLSLTGSQPVISLNADVGGLATIKNIRVGSSTVFKTSSSSSNDTTAITILSSGNVTMSQDLTVNGAFTSKGIDDNATSTALTITNSGIAATLTTAAQPNITSVGTLTGFTSTGIDDNATSTAMTISSAGNVSVGGAFSGGTKLHVRDSTSVTAEREVSRFEQYFTPLGDGAWLSVFVDPRVGSNKIRFESVARYSGTSTDSNFAFGGQTSTYLSIRSDGKVGVNKAVPGKTLDVDGDARVSGDVFFTGLPTSDPAVAGQLWNDSGTLKVSAG